MYSRPAEEGAARPARSSSSAADGSRRPAQERPGLQARADLRHQLRRRRSPNNEPESPVRCRSARPKPASHGSRRGSASAVAWAIAALPVHRRDHLSRAARGDLLHRPRHPDRSGAGDRRRPRAGQRGRAAREQYGLDLPLYAAIRALCEKRADRRFRQLGAVHQSGHDRTSAASFRRRIELATLGTLIGAVLGVPLGVLAAVKRGSLDRPGRARHRPDRLFGADLLARPAGAAALLRQARLGRGSGAHRHRL